MNAYVKRGRGYGGLAAFEVINPDAQQYYPGRTVLILPPHEEAAAWRAILAGFDTEDRAILVPLEGHFGDLIIKTTDSKPGSGMAHMGGGRFDGASERDECDFDKARALALSTALTFGLEGR